METAKVVSGTGVAPSSTPSSADVDALLELGDETSQQPQQQVVEQKQEMTEGRTNPSRRTKEKNETSASKSPGELRRKPFSKILRIARPKKNTDKTNSSTNESSPQQRGTLFRFPPTLVKPVEDTDARKRSTSKHSPQSRRRSSRDGQSSRERQETRRIPRSSSSQEGLPRVGSLQRLSLPRSSSERQYRTEVLQSARVSPRNSSRRWEDDDFGTSEQEEEGELDSFFRFVEDCTQAVWIVIKEIPVFLSKLPEMTMDILKRLIPALRGPTVPLIEGPCDEDKPSQRR